MKLNRPSGPDVQENLECVNSGLLRLTVSYEVIKLIYFILNQGSFTVASLLNAESMQQTCTNKRRNREFQQSLRAK